MTLRAGAETRDVVFTFSYLHWDGAQRRGMNFAQDRFAQTLLAGEKVDRVLVANWFRSAPIHVLRTLQSRHGMGFPATDRTRLHQPTRLRRSDPMTLKGIERAYRRYDRSLRRAAERMGLQRPATVTMHVLIAGFCQLDWAGPVTYYASDDWSASCHQYDAYVPMYEEAYRRIRENGRAVCAVSQPIVDRIAPTGPAVVVPNGIEPAQWIDVGPAPDWFTELPGPRLLYVGTIDRRIDVDMVRRSADAVPGGSVVLVGHMTEPDHFRPLRSLENVHLRDRVAHGDVPRLVAGADACLVPHTRMQLTEGMSPLKLYEYLAAGRPVAAADLPPIHGVSDRVVIDRGDFGHAVEAALELGPASEQERLEFVTLNSWRARHEALLDFAFRRGERSRIGATASAVAAGR